MSQPSVQGHDDLILKSARGLLGFFRVAVIIAGLAAIIALPMLVIFSQEILAELGNAYVESPPTEVLWAMAGVILILMLILLLSYFTIDRLRKVVASVRDGDPFIRINGVRLRGMGIAMLAIQVLTLALGAVVGLIIRFLGEMKDGREDSLHMDFGLSLSGILMVLLLIILARVFDRGAEMREELDGTI
ncbi:MAG: DUF2975 domain-containing protein [Parasphingorhabdus sp.]|uniref:DUF2975 domain-containing protein n=1 Tax=Parasphingorhabdus sp. TaxID=2709688 RepID=UPI003296C7AB